VPATSGRSRSRQGMHSGGHGMAGDHLRPIMSVMVATTVVIIFVLVMTKTGRDIDAATQHFMLFYAGVFALVGLTGAVVVGLVATDRTVMTPGHRVMAQAVHRAVSFGALAFLVIHIVTEILAQRVHALDALIPFLSPYRTFYIGLGTIASDLILLIVITSILRKRFTAHGKAWRWRAIHYAAYASFVFGVMHGLLAGRTAKPYVDWSYGAAIALTAVGLMVRFLAISLRPKESVSAAPGMDRNRPQGTSSLHAAALSLAQAQLGPTVQMLPPEMAVRGANPGLAPGPWAALGPAPVYAAAPVYQSGPGHPSYETFGSAETYHELGFRPLGAPPFGDDVAGGRQGQPSRQPLYEPEYDGPPRFIGAPRGQLSQDQLASYPYAQPDQRPQLGAGYPGEYVNRADPAGPDRPRQSRAIEPPRPESPQTAPRRQDSRNSGPMPRAGTGPMPRAGTGPMPRVGTGPMPRVGTGPMPRVGTGPMPRPGTGPMPRVGTGPIPRVGAGPMPRPGTGPMSRVGTGSMPRADTGPIPRPDTGPMPRVGAGPMPRPGTGPMPRVGTGPTSTGPGAAQGSGPQTGTGPRPGPGAARPGPGPAPRGGPGQAPRMGPGPAPRPNRASMPPDTGAPPRTGSHRSPAGPAAGPRGDWTPGEAGRMSRRTNSADPRYREAAGPQEGEDW